MPCPGLQGSSEFGVVVTARRDTDTVFRGLVTTRLAGDARESATAMSVAANGSQTLSRRTSPGRNRDPRMNDVQFARRALVPTDGNREQVAWLKAIGTGTQRKFVAVGNGDDVELPPLAKLPGTAANPTAPHVSAVAPSDGALTGVVYACRLSFDLGDLNPTTAMLRCQYVASNTIAAIRLNGKNFPAAGRSPGSRRLPAGVWPVHHSRRPRAGVFRSGDQRSGD